MTKALRDLGNVSLIERPVRVSTLVSMIHSVAGLLEGGSIRLAARRSGRIGGYNEGGAH